MAASFLSARATRGGASSKDTTQGQGGFDAGPQEDADEDAVRLACVEVVHRCLLVAGRDEADIDVGGASHAGLFPSADDGIPIVGHDEVHRGTSREDLMSL